jgi:hypothetical protein
MNYLVCSWGQTNIDWIAIVALAISSISVCYAVYQGRKTFRLTEEHNKKSVEPLITDLYISDYTNSQLQAYQITNCGIGPAIINSLSFYIDNIEYPNVNKIFLEYFKGQSYIQPSEYFEMSKNHVIGVNETLILFKFYFPNRILEKEFHELAKRVSFKLEYKSIYGDSKKVEKKKIAIA